jgi:putative nucleotidyltransferase with HDIG domain
VANPEVSEISEASLPASVNYPFVFCWLRNGMRIASASSVLNPNQASEIRLLVIQEDRPTGSTLEKVVTAPGMTGEICTSVARAHGILGAGTFDVVLLNLGNPDREILNFLDECRRQYPMIATIAIADSENIHFAVQVAGVGASDYFVEMPHPETAIVRIRRAVAMRRAERDLEERRLQLECLLHARIEESQLEFKRLEQTSEEMLYAFGLALGLRDNETAQHCHRVTRYSLELAGALGCSSSEMRTIHRGAFLHDIGKIGIPDRVLHKPGPLTSEERAIMEKHVRIGYEIVHRIPSLAASAEIVLTHHERFDGAGYPQGLRGREIPLGSRIFAVADAFDAMTSDRPYRRALPETVARDEILRESGGQFDPEVVQAFLSISLEHWVKTRKEVEQMLASNPLAYFEHTIDFE